MFSDLGPTFREVAIAYSAFAYDATVTELKSKKASRHLVMARTLFIYLVRKHRPNVSLEVIGRWINRDHSTVINCYKKSKILMETDPHFRLEVERFVLYLSRKRV